MVPTVLSLTFTYYPYWMASFSPLSFLSIPDNSWDSFRHCSSSTLHGYIGEDIYHLRRTAVAHAFAHCAFHTVRYTLRRFLHLPTLLAKTRLRIGDKLRGEANIKGEGRIVRCGISSVTAVVPAFLRPSVPQHRNHTRCTRSAWSRAPSAWRGWLFPLRQN